MNRLIGAAATFYGGLGAVALLRPETIPATFGGTATTPDSRTEVRAVYGGLPLAVAAALVVRPETAGTMGVLTAGMAAGRAASALAERRTTAVTPVFVAVEAVVAAALFAGARRLATPR